MCDFHSYFDLNAQYSFFKFISFVMVCHCAVTLFLDEAKIYFHFLCGCLLFYCDKHPPFFTNLITVRLFRHYITNLSEILFNIRNHEIKNITPIFSLRLHNPHFLSLHLILLLSPHKRMQLLFLDSLSLKSM